MDNDDIYPAINHQEKALAKELKTRQGPDAEQERKPRSKEEMRLETERLRVFFDSAENIWDN